MTDRATTARGATSRDPSSRAPAAPSDDLLRKADRALYEAKAAGRNCTRVAGGLTSDWWLHADSNLKIMHS